MDKYLYQYLDELLTLDASNLDLEVISKDEHVDCIISSLARPQAIELSKIRASSSRLENATKVRQKTAEIKILLDFIKSSKQISDDDAKLLRDSLITDTHTGYGIECEDDSLKQYELKSTWEVVERNQQLFEWHVSSNSTTDEHMFTSLISESDWPKACSIVSDSIHCQEHVPRNRDGERSKRLERLQLNDRDITNSMFCLFFEGMVA